MNKFLRTASSRQLLTAIAGAIAAIVAGTAIAIAAQGRGPVPRPEPLARAIHQGLAAPAVTALSARISFTNNLISSSEIQGSTPLLSGATGRLWYSAGRGLRLELQGDNGDTNLVVRRGSFWAYYAPSNTVYQGRLPARGPRHGKAESRHDALPTIAQIETDLGKAMRHLVISGAVPGDLAGRPTYTVRVSPRQSGGMLGAAELAWDALRGVPLRAAIYAREDSTPVLALSVTGISYGKVPGSVFSITPPTGAKVVTVSPPTRAPTAGKHRPAAVPLTFKAVEPGSLAGLPRTSATRLGRDGVAILYGRYLGGIAVIERPARSVPQVSGPPSGDQPGVNLPSISVGGSRGQELDTAIGTAVWFSRAGIEYTVIGSVPPRVAEAAARAL